MDTIYNHRIFFFYIILFCIIMLCCNTCWIVSVTFIIIGTGFKCISIYITAQPRPPNTIYPIQELNPVRNRNRRLIVTIQEPPDFSRLYIKEVIRSPLHAFTFCCSICLDESKENIKTLLCGHEFHQTCIEEWFKREETCPLCRDEFNEL